MAFACKTRLVEMTSSPKPIKKSHIYNLFLSVDWIFRFYFGCLSRLKTKRSACYPYLNPGDTSHGIMISEKAV